jgi:orotate phosphoribosyltransferase-like protein
LRRTSEADERRVLKLKQGGMTQREIADELKMPRSTVAAILKRSPDYETPLATDGWVSSWAAAERLGLHRFAASTEE